MLNFLRTKLQRLKKRKYAAAAGIAIIVMVFFQNCSKGFESAVQTGTLGLQSQSSLTVPPLPPAACPFNNGSVADQKTVTAFQSATVPPNQKCVQEERLCTNGQLSGSFTFGSCSPLPHSIKVVGGYLSSGCFLIDDRVKCWGSTSPNGPMFAAAKTTFGTPALPETEIASGVSDIAIGGYWFECHIIGGALTCSGTQAGGPFMTVNLTTAGATLVAVTHNQVCAVVSGKPYCWDLFSQMISTSRIEIPISEKILEFGLSSGGPSCALVEGGAIKCWTTYNNQILGTSETIFPAGATKISVNMAGNICFIAGTNLYCRGIPNTDGSDPGGATPTLMMTNVVDVKLNNNGGSTRFACAVKTDTSLQCWGVSLGTVSPVFTLIPTGVAKIHSWNFTDESLIFEKSDGAVWARGRVGSQAPDPVQVNISY